MSLRTVARRLLAAGGLAPVAQVERLAERAALLEGQLAELRRSIQDARAAADRWKDEAQEHARRMAALQETNRRLSKTQGEAADWKARDEKHVNQVHILQNKLKALGKQFEVKVGHAEHLIATTRESLMATETKLDIVEAAINVLDSRTRGDDVPDA